MKRGIKRNSIFNDDESKNSPEEGRKTLKITEITSFVNTQNDRVNEDEIKMKQVSKPGKDISSPVLSELAKIIEQRSKISFEDEVHNIIREKQYQIPTSTPKDDTSLHEQGKEWLRSMGWDFETNNRSPVHLISQRPQFLGLGAKVATDEGDESFSFNNAPGRSKPINEIFKAKRVKEGEHVYIIKGVHSGLEAHIIKVNKEEANVIVNLDISGTIIELDRDQISTEPPHSKNLPEELSVPSGDWIRLGMLVRISSRTWNEGAHYWKCGQVMDILPTNDSVIIKIDGESSLQQADKHDLIPLPPSKIGDIVTVIALESKYKELHGKVTFLNQNDVALQLLDDNNFIYLQLDALCLLAIDQEE
jgi:transcription antitermination factor NusG